MSEQLMFLMGFIEEDDALDDLLLRLISKYPAISYDKIQYSFMFTHPNRLNKRLCQLCKRNIIQKINHKNVIIFELIR